MKARLIKEIEPQREKIPDLEPEKIEEEREKGDISILILKTLSKIEEAEKEGAQRYAKQRLKNARRLLKEAKEKDSIELALSETKEKISYYSSTYIMGILKNIGK